MNYNTKKITKEELEKLSKEELIKLLLEKNKSSIKEKNVISSPQTIFKHIEKIKIDKEGENFILIMLTSSLEVIGKKVMFMGDVDNISSIPPKVLLRECFRNKRGISKIIVSHNHPSGNISPSESDIQYSKELKKCCDLMDIVLLDHIIFYGKNHLSMKTDNYL